MSADLSPVEMLAVAELATDFGVHAPHRKPLRLPLRKSPIESAATLILLCVVSFISSTASAAVPISIVPSSFTLDGRETMQTVAVLRGGESGDAFGAIVPESLYTLESTDSSVVEMHDGRAIAVGDGSAEIELKIDNQLITSARVDVRNTTAPKAWNFRNEVQSILARQGCNMGACHGALAGKGGFRLSLRGYDAESDHRSIALEAQGRRIEVAAPGRSLLLAKPTGLIAHKGGVRLKTDSRDYRIIASWIAGGATGPGQDDASLQSISVSPPFSMLKQGERTRLLVSAHYDDGSVVDVTHWSQFSATDESVAAVDEDGYVTVQGSGEAAVLVWFGSKVQLARLTIPFENELASEWVDSAPIRNFIDAVNLQQLRTLRLTPNPRCDDEAFLRRATLDTIGRLPTADERNAFLQSVGGDDAIHQRMARDWVIDRLLGSEEFIDYWTYQLSDILLINGNRLRPAAVKAYYGWVRNAVATAMPWDDMVREILTAKGISTENGATNFYALHQSPEEMTENACQAFLGLSIGCAKCHNHPLEKWTNDQYYAMANLFARVRAKGWGGETRNGDGVRTLYVADSGELIQPTTGQPQPPAPLESEPLDFDDPRDRRVAMADWVTDPNNPYFARAITNRIWANFFGMGLVEAVDDLRLSNPASNERLMNSSAQHMIELGFDLRGFMRTILQSETYQRSSLPSDGNSEDTKYLSRYFPRRLMAEVLLDSIDQTLGSASDFNKIAFSGADRQNTDFYPKGTRAIELYDSAVASYFLKTFGRNPREITCDCQRSNEPSMVQVLHLSNGTTLNEKLSGKQSLISRMMEAGASDEEIIREVFVRALCREPTATELRTMIDLAAQYPEAQRAVALQDVGWSVLTSTEFTFNH